MKQLLLFIFSGFRSRLNKALLTFLIFIALVSCKKYPEDRIWFKRPKNAYILVGALTRYDVNGVDSLDSFSKYFVGPNSPGSYKDFRFFEDQANYHNEPHIPGIAYKGAAFNIEYSYVNKYKSIIISQERDTFVMTKKIFVEDGETWDILHFPTKKEKYLKIHSQIKGNDYLIQIGNK